MRDDRDDVENLPDPDDRNETPESGSVPPCAGARDPRRAFFRNCLGAMGALTAGFVAAPVITFLKRPEKLEVEQAVQVPLAELKSDQAIYRDFQGTPIVIVPGGDQPKVFDASCTHLGCIVRWEHGTQTFFCPCHGAIFDSEGRPLKGPTNQPLVPMAFEIKDGNIVVG